MEIGTIKSGKDIGYKFNGYILIKLFPDDFFYPMAHSRDSYVGVTLLEAEIMLLNSQSITSGVYSG